MKLCSFDVLLENMLHSVLRDNIPSAARFFKQGRGKKTANLLKNAFSDIDVETAIRRAGLPEDVRADSISISAFIALGREFVNLHTNTQHT